jgi:aldehyde dehydrogenase (NAD+)
MTTESVARPQPEAGQPKPDIPQTVARLRATFATGRTRSIDWRKDQLLKLDKMMVEHETAIAAALADDLDRKPFEAWMADSAATAAEARFAAKHVRKWARRKYTRLELPQLPGRGWVEYEPYGTVLVIGAWNYPFYLTLGPAVGAIAAGNAVVLKPSEIAPASSRLMAELVPQYLDTDAIAVVEGDGAVSQELIAQGFDRVFFTGGTEVGRKVYEGAASHLSPVTLELGGKSPVIVAADADIDVAAKRIAWIKLMNAGQTCVAPDYVLADATIRDELVSKIGEALTHQSDEPDGKRIVNQRQFDRLTSYLAATKGTVVLGGGSDASQLRIQPTVVVDPDPNEPLMTDEIFGPILPVLTVQSLD